VLRAYFAWKRGLPFSYEGDVEPRGHTRDIRYTPNGNEVTARTDVLTYSTSGYEMIDVMRDAVSSASYRIHPDLDGPYEPDLYSPAIKREIHPARHDGLRSQRPCRDDLPRRSQRPPAIYRCPSRQFGDARLLRRTLRALAARAWARASRTGGPMRLVGATRRSDGVYHRRPCRARAQQGHRRLFRRAVLRHRQAAGDDGDWAIPRLRAERRIYDYYDYVRAKLAGGKLEFDPVKEVRDMVDSNCNDLHYRGDAVTGARRRNRESARARTAAAQHLRHRRRLGNLFDAVARRAPQDRVQGIARQTERFVKMYEAGDPKLVYKGKDLVGDLIATYDREAGACKLAYARTTARR
jgi:hypothetical protein